MTVSTNLHDKLDNCELTIWYIFSTNVKCMELMERNYLAYLLTESRYFGLFNFDERVLISSRALLVRNSWDNQV